MNNGREADSPPNHTHGESLGTYVVQRFLPYHHLTLGLNCVVFVGFGVPALAEESE